MEDSGIDSGDTKPSIVSEEEGLFNAVGSDSSCGSSSSPPRSVSSKDIQPIVVVSSCIGGNASTRQIQRKLEARIEQAKRKHRLQEYKKTTQNLIPIERLPIPGVKEQQPLVDWETDESEEDIANFFPINRVKEVHKHQELTDTFSIEEMSISGGEDEDEEDDLHLVPPTPLNRQFDCCLSSLSTEKCSIM